MCVTIDRHNRSYNYARVSTVDTDNNFANDSMDHKTIHPFGDKSGEQCEKFKYNWLNQTNNLSQIICLYQCYGELFFIVGFNSIGFNFNYFSTKLFVQNVTKLFDRLNIIYYIHYHDKIADVAFGLSVS